MLQTILIRPCGRILAASLCAMLAVSCGGGGKSGNTIEPPPPPPPPPPASGFAEATSGTGISFGVGYSENAGDEDQITIVAGGAAGGDYAGIETLADALGA